MAEPYIEEEPEDWQRDPDDPTWAPLDPQPPIFNPMCRCVIVPIPGILETTERAMLSDILGVPYDWAYEYVEVRIKQLKEVSDDCSENE